MDIRESIGNGDTVTIGGDGNIGSSSGGLGGGGGGGGGGGIRDDRLISSPSTSSLINSNYISAHHPNNSISHNHNQPHLSYSSPSPLLSPDCLDDHDESKSPTFGRFLERNAIYLYEQFVKIIEGRGKGSRSPFVTSLCISLIVIYLINLLTSEWGTSGSSGKNGNNNNRISSESNSEFFWTNFDSPITEMFTLTPGNILSPRFWIWSAISTITYPLIELHWWQVVNDVLAIYLSSTLIEPLWGSRELFSFFLIINLSVAFLTTSHYIILYSIYGSDEYLYNVRLYGCSAYCAAICVSIKQLLPESVLIGTPFGKFKNNNVPLAGLFVPSLLYILNIIESSLVLMFFYGLLVSWIYLRFIQNHPNGHRGDLSDSFSFASFFPSILKPGVSIISNCIYSFFVAIRLCSPIDSRQYQPLRVLGERLNQEHDSQPIPMRGHKFKHHQSGDYQYLSQPMHV